MGFGPRILGRQVGDTEYVVSAIPLGGYVKMFGEEAGETISDEEAQVSFMHQSLPNKMLIVAAGPGFNFILSYLIFTGMLAMGSPLFVPNIDKMLPVVETITPNSPAALSGLEIGDRITRVNEEDISTLGELYHILKKTHGRAVTLDVMRGSTSKTFIVTPTTQVNKENPDDDPIYLLGLEDHPPIVGKVMPNTPAMNSGLQPEDRIIQINETPIVTWSQMTEIVRNNAGISLKMVVERDGGSQTISITPEAHTVTDSNGETLSIGRIGIQISPKGNIVRSSSLFLAPWDGLKATWDWCILTVEGIVKLITGEISSKNIGGPLMIASVSGEHAEQGLEAVLWLIAILSINLGILNLLPIPVLDGGHLFFFACEAIFRSPPSRTFKGNCPTSRNRGVVLSDGFCILE